VSLRRKGGWMQTFSGKAFFPLDPRAEEVDIYDIAHHLSMMVRWTGAVREFYSVAEHSVRVSLACASEDAMWGLLHDAPEAYISDLHRPLKHDPAMKVYREIEDRVMMEVCNAFHLQPYTKPKSVQIADGILLVTEHRDLMGMAPKVDGFDLPKLQPLLDRIVPWTQEEAKSAFLARYRQLLSVVRTANGKGWVA